MSTTNPRLLLKRVATLFFVLGLIFLSSDSVNGQINPSFSDVANDNTVTVPTFFGNDNHDFEGKNGVAYTMPFVTGGSCVAGTINRFTGSYHSNLYIGNSSGTNILLGWGQNMATYLGTGSGDITTPTIVNATSYGSGIPLEVRSSSAGGATGLSAMVLRTSNKLYLFGTAANITAITTISGFGGAGLTTAASDITSKLPTGILVTDISQMAISQTAFAIVTNAGEVYITTKTLELQGDRTTLNSAVWHKVLVGSSGSTALTGVTKFSLSSSGAFALTNNGKIYYWGSSANVSGVVNTSTKYSYAFDMSAQIPIGVNVTDLVVLGTKAPSSSTLFLLCSNNKVYGCGLNTSGVLGINNATYTTNQATFQPVKGIDGVNDLTGITRIDGDTEADIFSMGAMDSNGKIFGWGDSPAGMLGQPLTGAGTGTYPVPKTIQLFTVAPRSGYTAAPSAGYTDFSIAGHFTIAFYTNGSTSQYWYQGHNNGGSIGDPTNTTAYIIADIPAKLNATGGVSFDCSNTQPTISTTGTFSMFSTCTNTASATQSITISGSYLSDNIAITAPAGFEVSTSAGSGFGTTATLSQSGGNVSSTPIYIRITASATGTISGILSCTSTGASASTYTLTGTVNTLPVISTLTGASRTGAGTLTISGNTITSGATIDWYLNSTGGTALASGVISTTSFATGTISSTTNYFAQARNLTTGCISATRSMTTATINGSFTAGVIGTDQTICSGKSPNGLTSISDASGGSGLITYQWQQSTTSGTTNFTNISGQTLSTYTPGSLIVSTWYRRAAISTVDGTIYSSAVAISVNALPVASLPIDNSRTGAGPVIIGATASSGATLDWYATSTGGSVLTGGNGITTFTTPTISVTTTYFAEARTTTAPGCLSLSRVAVLATINGSFSPGSIAADQSICSGVVPTTLTSITDASGGTGAISYTWLKSTTSISSGFYTATGTYTSTTYSPGALTQTTYFKRTAKTTTGSDGTIETNVITITVNPLPSTPVGVNGSRYGTGTVNINATVNSPTTETVDWYEASTGGSVLSGGTGTLSFITPSISSTTNYYAQARNSITGCISAARSSVTASINTPASLTVNGTLSHFTTCNGVASSTQTITVSGSSLTANITLAALNGYEYSTDGTSFSNSKILPNSSGSISPTTVYIRLSSSATNGAGGNIIISTTGASDVNVATGLATINVAPAITIQPSNATQNLIQNATPTSLSVTATGSNLTYQWYITSSSISPTNTGGNLISGAINSSYTPLTGSTGTLYYYVTVSGACSPAVVSAVSGPIVVSASTSPTIGHVGDLTPFSECAGSASNAQTFIISGSSLSTNIVINALTGYEYSTDASTYTNTITLTQSGGTVAATNIYVRLVSGATSGAGGDITVITTGDSHLIPTGSATINTAPLITVQPSTSAQILVKNATATALSVTATGSNITYQWYSNASNNNTGGSPITGATSSTYTPSTSIVGDMYFYAIVSGTCTPDVTSNVSGIITINEAASISTSASLNAFTTCAGIESASQSFTVAGTNLSSDITIASLSGFEYSIDRINFSNTLTLVKSGSTVSATTIYIRLSNIATDGVGGDITISSPGASNKLVNTGSATVNAFTSITNQPSNVGETLIQNSTSITYSVAASGSGLTYQWYSNIVNSNTGGTLISGANSNEYRPSTLNIGTLYYYVVVSGACSNVTSNFSGAIVIIANPIITTAGTLTTFNACSGNSSTEQTFSVSGTNLTDDILVVAPTGYEVSLTTGTGFASNITLVNAGGTITNTTIYIRLSNSANDADGGNVTISSSYANSQIISTGAANVTINTVTLTSVSGTDVQTVNQNTPITNITFSTTGATGATFSGLPTGVSGTWTSNLVTISGSPSVTANSNYTVTLTGGCGLVTATGTINSLNPSLGTSTIVVNGSSTYNYNGTAQGPLTSNVTGSTATPTYSYSGTGGTTYGPSSTPPTAAGTYQVVASIAGDANFNGANSTAFPFTINLNPPSIISINRVQSATNNLSTLNFIATFSKDITAFDVNDLTIVYTGTVSSTTMVVNAISASTYTITINGITGNGTLGLNLNTTGTGIVDLYGTGITNGITGQVYNIDKITNTPSILSPTSNANFNGQLLNLSYNIPEVNLANSITLTFQGISNTVIINLNNTSGVVSGTLNINNLATSSLVSSSSQPTLPADLYSVRLSYQDYLGNPVASTTLSSLSINIKAPSTIVATGTITYTYNGTPQGPVTSTVTGSTATPTYSYSGTGTTTYGPSATLPTAAGAYQVIATVTGDANYDGANATAYNFIINKAPSTIVATGTITYTYNGTPQGPVTSTVTGSTATPTYSYSGTGTTTYGPNATLPTTAGTYQVIATVAGDANYNEASSAPLLFTIIQTIPVAPAPPIVISKKYIYKAPNLPTTLNSLVTTFPTGSVPAWCTVGTLNCSTTAPAVPTAIGKYIYQLRTYDTTTHLYSTLFVNDTLIIAPPVPIVNDSTFVIGVSTNPANVGVQVTGMSGAVLNFYYSNSKLNTVPVLGNIAAVKKYNVSQTINSIESDTASFTTTTLDPNSIIHLQKIVDSGKLQSNSTFNYQFTFVVTNLTKYPFSNVVLTDNLHNSVPISSEFDVIKKSATGGLVVNQSFDGNNDIKLTTSSSYLEAFAKDTARFIMNLAPKGYNGTLTNIGYVKVDTKWGTIIMQSSANSSADLSTKNPTNYFVKDLRVSVPEGFSPNNDGIHDKLVIIRPYNTIIDISVFNRWGNVVYSNSNYQNDWDGKGTGNFAGKDLIDGGYYYTIKVVEENGKIEFLKGFVIIQR
jgi:gliding motility-associated-like protein